MELSDSAGGQFEAAVGLMQASAAERVAALAERDHHRVQRERAERFTEAAGARVAWAEGTLAKARKERDLGR